MLEQHHSPVCGAGGEEKGTKLRLATATVAQASLLGVGLNHVAISWSQADEATAGDSDAGQVRFLPLRRARARACRPMTARTAADLSEPLFSARLLVNSAATLLADFQLHTLD